MYETKVPAEIYENGSFSLEDAEGTPVPVDYYLPKYEPGWTVFDGPLQDHHFLKESPLDSYDVDDDPLDWPSRELRDEIEIYEKLKCHPHPNIVNYHGVVVKNDRVTGIVIDKVDSGLYDALGGPCKASHIVDIEVAMRELQSAVEHLHSIGIVHCDISPHNLGVDANGRILLFDFDCAFAIGTKRYGKIYNGSWNVIPDILEAEFACVEIDYECLKLTRQALLEYPQKFEVITSIR
ncbi:kinase-like protein [Cystobasidium minutum MCA 4210]|uniref:kinase-like protein n=1 Tax=Cystobasidium minutum MCA 4210 TaxID=1397322 RepID=UPI0034CE6CFC|eukprot:jgi/Rhomi1/195384/gm1.3598_g